MISDTTLSSFIPLQVRKMNPRLRQICGCEIFTIPKNIYIDLNIFKRNFVSDLKQKPVVRNTHTSVYSTTSSEHNKEKNSKW